MSMHNPAHPGEILKELVITPLELTITDVSKHLNVSRKTLSKVLNGRGAITPEMALRLELAFKAICRSLASFTKCLRSLAISATRS